MAASQELTERAKLLIAERRYQEAVRACRRALLSQPDQVDVRLLLGEALLALSRYDEVRVEMMALLRKAPDRAEAHRLLGEAYLRDGRQSQAVESLRRAAQLDPSDEATRDLLAEAKDDEAGPPPSTTIERWFAEEAQPTVETALPEFDEDHTGPVPVLKNLPAPAPAAAPQRAALAPSQAPLPAPLPAPAARPAVRAPIEGEATKLQVRSRKPTIAGPGAAPVQPQPQPQPLEPQPHSQRQPRPQAPPASAAPFRAKVPQPASLTASPTPLGNPFGGPSAPFGSPPFGGPAAPFGGPPKSAPPSPRPQPAPPARPVPSEPTTDELSLEPDSGDELAGEPTRAHVPSSRADSFESERTRNFSPVTEADLLEEEPPTLAPAQKARPIAPPGPAPKPRFPEPAFPPEPAPQVPRPQPRPAPTPAPAPTPVTRRGAKRPRWLLPGGLGLIALWIVVVGAWLAIDAWRESSATEEIRALAVTASDTGSRRDLEAVLARLDEAGDSSPERRALRARTLAVLVFEHGLDRAAEAGSVAAEVEPQPDARLASAYLLLARGEPQASQQLLSHLPVEGDQIQEGYRARAFAREALGHTGEAREAAATALRNRPSAPRHVALAALTDHLDGDGAAGLARLEQLPEAGTFPAVRVVRARILQETGSDPARAVQEAQAVVQGLSDRATRYELAWSHLVIARHALDQGSIGTALSHARLAAASPPPVDEPFVLGLAEVLLRAGAPTEADRQLARPNGPPIDPSARALLSAEVALAAGQLDRAEQQLGSAQDGARKSYLTGRVLERRGRPAEARPHYQRAMDVPGPDARRARVRLGALALRDGRAAEAVRLLEPARTGPGDDVELLALLARAYIAANQLDQAQEMLRAAVAQHPGATELLAAQGNLMLRRGQAREAVTTLERAAQGAPSDPEIQLDLGDAARATGERDRARRAYDRALELRAGDARAIVGLATLLVAERNYDEATRRLAGQPGLEAARLRAEIPVRQGAGAAAIDAVRAILREHNDAVVWAMLGHLQSQAEQDRDASSSYREAARLDASLPEVALGRATLEARGGSPSAARRALEAAEAAARRRHLDLRARLLATQGRVAFEEGRFDAALASARDALALEPQNGVAHYVVAMVAIERDESPTAALQASVAGDAPPAEAVARLAIRLGSTAEGCRLALRYLEVAPEGYDAGDVRDVAAGCR